MSYNNPPAPQDQNGHPFPPLVIKNADGTYTFVNATTGLPVTLDTTTLAKDSTLGQILSKIIAAPATETKQDAQKAVLDSLLNRLGQNLLTVEQAHTITDNTVTIASGQSVSGAINLAGLTVIRISMPSAWTTANLTVQTSRDNVTYQDLFDQYGSPFTIAAGASRNINLNPADLLGLRWIRLVSATVSGATITPVAQTASREINIVATNV